MNIGYILIIILIFTGCLSLINTMKFSANSTSTMFISTAIQSSSSSLIPHYARRRSSVHFTYARLNTTDDSNENNMSLSTNTLSTFDQSYEYNVIKDGSNLTKTQIKVIVTVVIIISFIMFIIAIFRFKNACREQETHKIQTEVIRHRTSQYSEPSSRRGSIGYYTRKYTRAPSFPFEEQLNISSPTNRSSIPACDQSLKPIATVILSSSPIGSSTTTHHHYVTSSHETTNNTNNQHVSTPIKPIVRKSWSTVGISRCDDHTPLLTSELASTIKDSSNRATRKYSLNAFSSFVRSPTRHPPSSSSTTTVADGNNIAGDRNKNRHSLDLTSRRQVSLSSAFRRNSIAKQLQTFCSTIDSASTNKTISLPITSLPTHKTNQLGTGDSDSTDRSSLLKTKSSSSKSQLRKKSSSITPITSSSSSSYRKEFMQKIERFRYIDDSASSTTTVTSPVESTDRINGHQPCSHLITSAIEQFDDYLRSRYQNNDEINSYIDRLNSDILTNGSYSDLNILSSSTDNTPTQQHAQPIQPQTIFKPVNNISSQSETNDYRQAIRNSTPMTIPSQHSKHAYPSDNSIPRPTTIITNGHSRSMDFQSMNNHTKKHELLRPIALKNAGTIYETSSSSIATLTSVRSSNSLEFDDDTKPSGVLVDDDFLPMSSPVDDHFWDITTSLNHHKFNNNNNNTECFPNVGSSPDIEKKYFDLHQINTLSSSIDQPFSETSCDEDDDDISSNHQKFSIQEYKLKELQKPIVIHRSVLNPSIHSTEPINHTNDLISIAINKLALERTHDESLLEKFASANNNTVQITIRSPPLRSTAAGDILSASQQYPQTIFEEDDTQESSTNDNNSDESADNGEIDLVHEFELSQKQEHTTTNNTNLWSTSDRDIFILQEDDLLSALVTSPTQQNNRPPPPSIMKMVQNKSTDSIDEQQAIATNCLRPKVRFNLDPQYEREREWNKVNKLLGNSVEWTDEFEV